jgi:hypothetical protein
MAYPLLTYSSHEYRDPLSLHDRVQIALAIADESLLKTLLVDCIPAIAPLHRIGSISTTIGVPIESRKAIDGIIQFESINCTLVDSPTDLEQVISEFTSRNGNQRGHLDLTRCEAETRFLGQTVMLSQALALLAHSGFSPQQVEEILHLPQDAWYKSWWYGLDEAGYFTVPFLRLIRTRRYTDGTFTIQYKDFFSQDKPPCFKSQEQKVLVEIGDRLLGFRKTLEKINYSRQQLGISQALLICDRLSDLEARGFMSQGISIYAAEEMMVPTQANCALCITNDCPMHGLENSPVLTCQRFCLEPQIG